MYRKGYYVEKNEMEAYRNYRHYYETMTVVARPLVGADVLMRLGDFAFEEIGEDADYELALRYYQEAE